MLYKGRPSLKLLFWRAYQRRSKPASNQTRAMDNTDEVALLFASLICECRDVTAYSSMDCLA